MKNHFKSFWTTNRTLIWGLTLPLLLATGIALWFSQPITVKEVSLNLATDFITIVITVWYVDWVLKRQEDLRWKNAEKYISSEAGKIGHSLISTITEAAKLNKVVFPKNNTPIHKRRIQDIQNDILAKVKTIDHDQIIANLKPLTASQWSKLMVDIKSKASEITVVISQFESKLSPEKLESLLVLREAINAAQSVYELLGNFLGVPESALPKIKSGNAFEYTAMATIRIGIDLRLILQASLTVIEKFEYVVLPPEFDYDDAARKSWDRYWS